MSDIKDDGGPAFPVAEDHKIAADLPWTSGMTLRDYFAAKAMPSVMQLVADGKHEPSIDQLPIGGEEFIAVSAYQIADAMLKARQS